MDQIITTNFLGRIERIKSSGVCMFCVYEDRLICQSVFGLEFDSRALCMLGKHSYQWAMVPVSECDSGLIVFFSCPLKCLLLISQRENKDICITT